MWHLGRVFVVTLALAAVLIPSTACSPAAPSPDGPVDGATAAPSPRGPVTPPPLPMGAAPAPSRAASATLSWHARRSCVPMRYLSVRCASDEEFRAAATGRWETDAKARIAAASAVFEREFRVSLRVVSYAEWTSAGAAVDIHQLHRDATARFLDDDADLLVVFLRQDSARAARVGSYDRGVSYYYGRTAIVRTGVRDPDGIDRGAAWGYEAETLLHELGHIFGAWHAVGTRSPMRPGKVGDERIEFDATSTAAIALGRQVDLRRGADGLTAAQISEITALWRESKFQGTIHPVIDAHVAAALLHELAGRTADAAAQYERGLAVAGAAGVTDLPPVLRQRAWRAWAVREPGSK